MAQDPLNPDQVVIGEEIDHVRSITLNRPRQLNVISSQMVYLLAELLEKWEKDDNVKLVIFKGAGRAFSAGGDLKMFYEGRSGDSCLEVVYRMYWLCYHIHTYKKPTVALVHGIVMGGGGAMVVPLKFSVVTEKTVFATPEAAVGLHTDCSFSYILSRLPGSLGYNFFSPSNYKHTVLDPIEKKWRVYKYAQFPNELHNVKFEKNKINRLSSVNDIYGLYVLHSYGMFIFLFFSELKSTGEYMALTGARLNGKEMVAAGLATHFVPSERLSELEKRLISLNSGDEAAIREVLKEFSLDVQPDKESILNKMLTINKCFCKESVEEIIKSFEAEVNSKGNDWIAAVLKGLKRSSPTGLKITLRSIREGREQTLAECLKKEFRLTVNLLRSVISGDVYEGIRALSIDKDNAPKWDPATLDQVSSEKVELVIRPLSEELELKVPTEEEASTRWDGKYEDSAYPSLVTKQ